ncbi:MAG: amino acid ABC transporter permease [Clostridia bacterium]
METWNIIQKALPALFSGLWVTLEIAVISLVIAMIIGLAFGLLRISNNSILRFIAECYVNIIRGTPLLVQVLFIYFGLPGAFDFKLSAFMAGVIAISINAGAYLVEIFRAGIESIDRGQMEAGRALGFTYGQTMNYVILPQAVKRMIPAFVNQFIITIKDTSLLSVIGIAELTMEGQTIYSSNFRAFEILGAIAVIYFILIYVLTIVSNRLERRLTTS